MMTMQKFGRGEVQVDETDPQGVSVAPETARQGASTAGERQALDVENSLADATPPTAPAKSNEG
jgi:hypothetical protein